LLVERIVSLSWRLQRASRIHNLSIDALDEDRSNLHCIEDRKEPEPGQIDLTLGHIAAEDFANTRILDGLIMYERRIEHSLYRSLFEFQRLQAIRKKENPHEVDEETEERLMCDRTLSAAGCEI
jgi:hypothetical protein